MDPDMKKLALLLVFQLSLLSTLECMARDDIAIFCVTGNNYVPWWLLCTVTSYVARDGDEDYGLTIEVYTN